MTRINLVDPSTPSALNDADAAAAATAAAAVDCGECGMGAVADESCPVGGVRQKPSQVEQVVFESAICAAYAQCFLSHGEAVLATRLLKPCGILISNGIQN